MRRFFSPDSWWNTPIATDARTDPQSDRLMALMAKAMNGFWLDLGYWTIPVYEADANTPRCDVRKLLSPRLRGAGTGALSEAGVGGRGLGRCAPRACAWRRVVKPGPP